MLDTDVSKCKITANAQYDPRSAEIIARNSSYFHEKLLWRGLRRGGESIFIIFVQIIHCQLIEILSYLSLCRKFSTQTKLHFLLS